MVLLHPAKIVLGTLFLLISIQIIYSKLGKGFEFFPPIEPDYAEIVVHARGNLSVYDKDKIIKDIEEITLKNKYISNIYSTQWYSSWCQKRRTRRCYWKYKIRIC